jgi:hypothetical protein
MTDEEIKEGGFNGFIHKPITFSKFDEIINKYR